MKKVTSAIRYQVLRIQALKAAVNNPKTRAKARLLAIDRLEREEKKRDARIEADRQARQTTEHAAQAAAIEAEREKRALASQAARLAVLEAARQQRDKDRQAAQERADAAAEVERRRLAAIPKAYRVTGYDRLVDVNGRDIMKWNESRYRLAGVVSLQQAIQAGNSGGKITLDMQPAGVEPWRIIERDRLALVMQEQQESVKVEPEKHRYVKVKEIQC